MQTTNFSLASEHFCGTIFTVDIFRSALRHGVSPDSMAYVVEHPLEILVLEEEPEKILHLGLAPDGVPLEVVTLDTTKYGTVIIHAMRMRTQYVRLIERRQ